MALRIFQPKRDKVAKDWQKLHNDKLHNLYSLLNTIRMIISRRLRWERQMSAYRIYGGKPEGKRPLGTLQRTRHRWEDNIKMDLRETGWRRVDWIHLAQDRNSDRLL
jgi:hypothetical protein